MKTRKFMLCQYPGNGFGSKNNQFYLLDQWGNKFDIVDEYDKELEEMNRVVHLGDGPFNTYCANSTDELIKTLEERFDIKIDRW